MIEIEVKEKTSYVGYSDHLKSALDYDYKKPLELFKGVSDALEFVLLDHSKTPYSVQLIKFITHLIQTLKDGIEKTEKHINFGNSKKDDALE